MTHERVRASKGAPEKTESEPVRFPTYQPSTQPTPFTPIILPIMPAPAPIVVESIVIPSMSTPVLEPFIIP